LGDGNTVLYDVQHYSFSIENAMATS
jgi:hypothetical protein